MSVDRSVAENRPNNSLNRSRRSGRFVSFMLPGGGPVTSIVGAVERIALLVAMLLGGVCLFGSRGGLVGGACESRSASAELCPWMARLACRKDTMFPLWLGIGGYRRWLCRLAWIP